MTENPDQRLFERRFRMNMQRINALVGLALAKSPAASGPLESDISRAIVVFLHATFEDMLRTVARQRLDALSPDALSSIPLSGLSGRAEKFHLGALASHRGKTVDELLRESVSAYWERETFSSCDDVDKALRLMGLDSRPFKFMYAGLESMMKRRHQIVHDADLPNHEAHETTLWGIADRLILAYWLMNVATFNAQLHVSIDPADEVHGWFLARRKSAIGRARDVIRQGIDLPKLPKRSLQKGVQKWANQLNEVLAMLGQPADDEIQEIARKTMKSRHSGPAKARKRGRG